ncbi:MAG: hypothetical protein GKR91_04470 [Pseudomonadales bacterium]|nr:hypothetical protein [Pseudomonadales bacterium]
MALTDRLHNNSIFQKAFFQGHKNSAFLRFVPLLAIAGFSFSAAAQTNEATDLTLEENSLANANFIDSTEFNVYSVESLDPLIDLGLYMQEQGNHQEAVAYFKQARQVSRIKHGFYDETQVALLEAIIESEMLLKNFEAVDNHYSHMEYLYRRLYDIDDPRLETGLQKVSGWLSYALSINPVGNRVDQLRKANRVYKTRLEIAEQTLSSNHPRFNYLLENIAICEKQLYQFLDKDGSGMKRSRQRRGSLVASLD